MKILFVISVLSRGGQERQMTELALGLTRKGHEVHVAVAYPGEAFESVLEEHGVTIWHLHPGARFGLRTLKQRLSGFAQRWWRLRRLISRERYDVVHGYGEPGNMYAALAVPPGKASIVWGWRGSTVLSNRYGLALMQLVSRRVGLVICNSHAGSTQILRDGIRPRRVEVIENGIDTERCLIDDTSRTDVRNELGIAPDELLIGVVANIHPWKGHAYLVNAFGIVAEKHPVRLLILGNDYHHSRAGLEQIAMQHGVSDAIIWRQSVSDVERYMNGMDILVSSSLTEGFSNVIAEAMACGVPCVVTDVGDSSRIVGQHGVTVPPADAEALAEGIERQTKALPVCRAQIRRSIVDRFSVDLLVSRTESALEGSGT